MEDKGFTVRYRDNEALKSLGLNCTLQMGLEYPRREGRRRPRWDTALGEGRMCLMEAKDCLNDLV